MGLSNFQLKIIALITMTIDHIGVIIFPESTLLRIIGRISFILFAFLLVEGFNHTSNKTRYITVIGLFAFIISLCEQVIIYVLNESLPPNIFLTLFLGLLILSLLDTKSYYNKVVAVILLLLLGPFVEYSYYGLIIIILFYYKYKYELSFLLFTIIFLLINYYFCYLQVGVVNHIDDEYIRDLLLTTQMGKLQMFSFLALPFIYFYNHMRGYYNKVVKYLIYIFYPIHLVVLFLLNEIILYFT